VGQVRTLERAGPDRCERVAASWRALAADALADDPSGPAGSGLVAVGGLAFAADGGSSHSWKGFAPASFVVPEVALARRAGQTWLTVNLDVAPDDTAADARARIARRLAQLRRSAALPLLDPAPVGAYEVLSPMAPAHYEEAVARAVQRIRSGELEKIVLAREVEVHAPLPYDPGAVLGLLREAFSSSFVYAVGRGQATFIGASPELLIRREGQRASTVALAGSARRSADPAVDDHLGEQLLHSDKDRHENRIVGRRIVRKLRSHAVWVTAAPEPVLVGLLHPTPAVGAEPATGLELIPALEGFDRGWYAGPLGWSDASGDGEFCVALRCALLRGQRAHCYAGCGIVRDSSPAAELAESEVKLGVMRPALTG
jgi:salicylate biosynthesis isochorismate synthase/menaquinone-specific isochorismate synthase